MRWRIISGQISIRRNEKTALADAITSVNEKMKERGIRFVMFEAPNKESVYAEYMPDSVRVYGSESRLDRRSPELAAQGTSGV